MPRGREKDGESAHGGGRKDEGRGGGARGPRSMGRGEWGSAHHGDERTGGPYLTGMGEDKGVCAPWEEGIRGPRPMGRTGDKGVRATQAKVSPHSRAPAPTPLPPRPEVAAAQLPVALDALTLPTARPRALSPPWG